MCDLTENFKLCSCDANKLKNSEIGWYLDRINPSLPLEHRKGKAAMPRFNKNEKDCLSQILESLTTRNCFDFEYTPALNDRLCVKVSGKWYPFRFSARGWESDKSTSLSAWRTQLERKIEGNIC